MGRLSALLAFLLQPDLDLYELRSKEISQANYGGCPDKTLDERRAIREFEKRMTT